MREALRLSDTLVDLEPHLRTAFGFIGITEIEFAAVRYDEFPDDRIERSLAAAEAEVRQIAHQLAEGLTANGCVT